MIQCSHTLQEKHVETAKLLLGEGRELNSFVSRLLDDMANLKAMLHAISIGEPSIAHLNISLSVDVDAAWQACALKVCCTCASTSFPAYLVGSQICHEFPI